MSYKHISDIMQRLAAALARNCRLISGCLKFHDNLVGGINLNGGQIHERAVSSSSHLLHKQREQDAAIFCAIAVI